MTRPALRLEPLESREVPAVVGGLDPSFGGGGLLGVAVDAGNGDQDTGNAVAVQSDGKIVLAGWATVDGGGNTDFAVIRLLPDGSRDESFGPNGVRTIGFDLGGGNSDQAFAVAIQTDGKIVVVGHATRGATDRDFAFVRLNPDGTRDATFDPQGLGPGKAVIAFDLGGASNRNEDEAVAVAIQPDGKIVAVGSVARSQTDVDFGVARLNSDGTADATFGNLAFGAGKAVVPFDLGGDNEDHATGVVIQPDGRIVVGGRAERDVGDDFAAARLSAAGVLDNSFGADMDGRVVVGFNLGGNNDDQARGIALQPDGKVVLVGTVRQTGTTAAGDRDIGVVRLTADGLPDPAFNPQGLGAGKAAVAFDAAGDLADFGSAVVVDSFGCLVVVGLARTAANGFDFGVARLNVDGTPDTSFGPQGERVIAFNFGGDNSDEARGVAFQPDGRLVVVGTIDRGGTDTDFGVARLIADIGLPGELAVSGAGAVPVFVPGGGGFDTTPVARPTPIAGVAVNSVLADVNGDGTPDLVSGQTAGGDRVVVLDGRDETGGTVLASFSAFGGFGGGVFVAGGDLTGDGRAEVVVSPVLGGLGPRVAVFSGASMVNGTSTPTKLADFNGIADAQTGAADNSPGTIQFVGARVAVGDATGDWIADLAVAAGNNGGPRITIWDGKNVAAANGGTPAAPPLANAFVFEDSQRDGAFVTLGDVTGDGLADLIAGGGPNGGPRVRIGDMAAILAAKNFGKFDDALGVVRSNFLVGDPNSRGGIRVAARDLDGDNLADLVTGSGARLPSQVQVFRGSRLASLTSGVQTGDQVFDPFGAVLADGVYVG